MKWIVYQFLRYILYETILLNAQQMNNLAFRSGFLSLKFVD